MNQEAEARRMHVPTDWTFKDMDVAAHFDQHVREQLPWYDLATGVVSHVGRHYLPEGGRMYDLGASTGNITLGLKSEIEKRNVEAVSLDYSEEMGSIWRGVGSFEVANVLEYEYKEYDLCVSFLLMMFLPPARHREFLERLLKKRRYGGALVLFDKTSSFDGYLGTVMHRLTLAGKVATRVPSEEIVQKELSLAGAQRPICPASLLFHTHGGREIFRFGEFAGWVFTSE